MNVRHIQTLGPVRAEMAVPGSKSMTNRALICAALAKGESTLLNVSDSDDSALMANGLNQLGVLARKVDDAMIVEGTGGKLYAPKYPIPVGNAGTTFRFLLSLAALAQGTVVFEGSDRMAERPLDDLLAALRDLNVNASKHPLLPRWEVRGGTLQGGAMKIRGDKSSQFLTSLLLVAPVLSGGAVIEVEGHLTSRSYVAMTVDVMKQFGMSSIEVLSDGFFIPPGQGYRPSNFTVEADASGASYPLAIAAITGGEITALAVKPGSTQGDAKFVDVMERMGCEIHWTDRGVTARRTGELSGIDIDMNAMPDVVPTLAAVALFAKGRTRIRNVAHLRFKESDRLQALATELGKLGAHIELIEDGLEITPAPLRGCQLATYDDHRLAMSFALAGLRVPGVCVENPDCVRKSYPEFWNELEKLYAHG